MSTPTNVERDAADEDFVRLLTAEQFPLLHYIAMLLGDPHSAHNVLQETNLVLWRKASTFEPGTNFSAWARKVAYWQVQAFIRDKVRDRHVFTIELLDQLANRDEPATEVADAQLALRHCLGQVSKRNLGLIRGRYEDGQSIATLAESLGRTKSAIKVQLLRLRRQLLKCIQTKLKAAPGGADG